MTKSIAGTQEILLARRSFLARTTVLAGGLIVGFHLPTRSAMAQASAGGVFSPNAYLRIGADDSVTIVVALVEMGQGTFTSIPMLIAEELEVELARVRVEQAPANEKIYGHPLYVLQTTGGSASISAAWAKLRQVGATAKLMLVTAAAQEWNVAAAECRAEREFRRSQGLTGPGLHRKCPVRRTWKGPAAFCRQPS